MKEALKKIAEQFALEGAITAIDSLGEGFINDTFIVRTQGDAPDYILQRKNKEIFPNVPAMMENIRKVTDHIRRGVVAEGGDPRRQVIAEGGDPMREAMTVVPTHDGKLCYEDEAGEFWAVTVFIADTIGAITAVEHRPKPVRSLISAIFFCFSMLFSSFFQDASASVSCLFLHTRVLFTSFFRTKRKGAVGK